MTKIAGISVKNRKVTVIPIAELKPYINNPRENAESIRLLEKAIAKYGFTVPITVDEDLEIVTGNSRYHAARNIGLEELPCIVLKGLSRAQVMEYRIADNKTQEFSMLDYSKRSEDLEKYAKEDDEFADAFGINFDSTDGVEGDEVTGDGSGVKLPEITNTVECMCPYCLEELIFTRSEIEAFNR